MGEMGAHLCVDRSHPTGTANLVINKEKGDMSEESSWFRQGQQDLVHLIPLRISRRQCGAHLRLSPTEGRESVSIFLPNPQLSKAEDYSRSINSLAFLAWLLHWLILPRVIKGPQVGSSRDFMKQDSVCRGELWGYGRPPIAIVTPTL